MSNQINEAFLSSIENLAKQGVLQQTEPPITCDELVAWVCYTRHLRGTALDLLTEKKKAEKALKDTQYLSTLWIKALTSVMPKKMQKRALKIAGQAIAQGMQEAGMESYDVDFEELEKQINPE
ncbi:MAG: hypothetical protein ACXABY_23045 [Candidatus Thorarchaeota archaeon]|jgi:hypothetical protein